MESTAKRATQKLNSLTGMSCNSASKPVKVVHIGNPKMVTASESDFSAVVQSLTGNKRPSPRSATNDCSSSCKRPNRDCNGREAIIPKPEGKLEFRSILNNTLQRPIAHQNFTVGVSESDVHQKEITYDISYYPKFETRKNLGDNDLFQVLFPYFSDEGV